MAGNVCPHWQGQKIEVGAAGNGKLGTLFTNNTNDSFVKLSLELLQGKEGHCSPG